MDFSDAGTDPDPNGNGFSNDDGEEDLAEFQVVFSRIGVAKNATVDDRVVTFDYCIENFGGSLITDLSLPEDLDAVFGAGNYSIVSGPELMTGPRNLIPNPNFNGSTDTELISGSNQSVAIEHVRLVVEVNPITDRGSGFGVYSNQVTLSANGGAFTDLSDHGTDPDSNDNGKADDAGEDDPTTFSIIPNPVIGVAKTMSDNDSLGNITIDLYLEAFGNVPLSNVELRDDLDAVFGAGNYSISSAPVLIDDPGTINLNPAFDGSSDPDLIDVNGGSTLALGATAQIRFSVRLSALTDQGLGVGVYSNQATASAEGPAGNSTTDLSDQGTDPDPNDNRDPDEEGENDPTTIIVPPVDFLITVSHTGADTVNFSTPWEWNVTMTNILSGTAVFQPGDTLMVSKLPIQGVSFLSPSLLSSGSVDNEGDLLGSFDAQGNLVLRVDPAGSDVTVGGGASVGLRIPREAVTEEGTYINPVTGAMALADPNNHVFEVDENNNEAIPDTIVIDNTPPVARCKDATVNIGPGGGVTLDLLDIDDNSTDNLGIASYLLTPSAFDCSDIGEQVVQLKVTDFAGNEHTCESMVTVLPNNPGQITGRDTVICKGETIDLSTLVSGTPAGVLMFGTTFGNYNLGTQAIQAVDQAGTFYIVDDANGGCNDTARVTVSLFLDFTGRDTTICEGSQLDLSLLLTGAAGEIQEYGTVFGTYDLPSGVVTPPAGVTTYYVLGRDPNPEVCPDTAEIVVTVIPKLKVVADSLDICEGSPVLLGATFVENATYAWSGPNNFASTLPFAYVSPSGQTNMSGLYEVIVTAPNTCPDTAYSLLEVFAAPPVAFAGDDRVVCEGQIVLEGNDPSPVTGSWSFADNPDGNGMLQDIQNPLALFSGSGGVTYELRWTVAAQGACPATSDEVMIELVDGPTPAVVAPLPADFCALEVQLMADSVGEGTGMWTFVDPADGQAQLEATAPAVDGFSDFNPILRGTAGQTYTLQWTTELDACRDSARITVPFDTDADQDMVPDGCDYCPGGDDKINTDNTGMPDDCDCHPDSAEGEYVTVTTATIADSVAAGANPIRIVEDFEIVMDATVTAADPPVVLQAGNRVVLGANFHAQAGSQVFIMTKLCTAPNQVNTTLPGQINTIGWNLRDQPGQDLFELRVQPNLVINDTRIFIDLSEAQPVTLTLFDQSGRALLNLVDNEYAARGRQEYQFSAYGLPAGVYYLQLRGREKMTTRRLVIAR